MKNNAHTGAKIATVLAGRMGAVGGVGGAPGRRSFSTGATAAPRRPVVVGGAVVDIVASPAPGGNMVAGTSNPGVVRQSFGGEGVAGAASLSAAASADPTMVLCGAGVGRNIAECLARLQAQPSLVTVRCGVDSYAVARRVTRGWCAALSQVVGRGNSALIEHCNELGIVRPPNSVCGGLFHGSLRTDVCYARAGHYAPCVV